jgi:heme-degrading monooxygenase HmoA
MFCSLFEVLPGEGRKNDYLELAKYLKPRVERIDGFVDMERFESQLRRGWMLAIHTWRDEKSIVRWRTEAEHHKVQEKGRFEILADYHVRLGDVASDTAPPKGAPIHEQRFDETEVGAAKFATITELVPRGGSTIAPAQFLPRNLGLERSGAGIVDYDVWTSVSNPGKMALSVGWGDARAAASWMPAQIEGVTSVRHRRLRVVRDYGRFDRREAPQYYPDIGRPTAPTAGAT